MPVVTMRRLFILSGVAVSVLIALAAVSAGRSAVSLTVREGNPPQLLVPGDQAEVRYVIDTPGVTKPTGTLYLRRDTQSAFTALPLHSGVDTTNGRHPSLHLALPARFFRGKRLVYYAQLQDPASGASITIPAKGPRAPQTSWIMHRPTEVHLGPYRFGHPQAAQAVVARAARSGVGWDLAFQSGPKTFLVGRDRSIWLEDTYKDRMLIWPAGKPNGPVRSLRLPTEGRHDVSFQDVAFGPKGTLYVTRVERAVPGIQLFRINASTGKVLWKTANTGRDLPVNMPLRVGADGTLYGYVTPADFNTNGTPSSGWMPLATRAGKPVPPAQQFSRIVWGYQPASAGRRFIAENYLPPNARYISREMRFAIVKRSGSLLRAWRVVSKTSIEGDGLLWPQLLGGSIVADLLKVPGPGGRLEHFFVRLGSKGLDAKASVPYQLWGAGDSTDVRVGPDGRIYALATSPKTGIVIRRYALSR
jgi:hypothetical protein